MSNYPTYAEFGKSTRDFFTKGFQTGAYKLNIKDNASPNIKTTITGTHTFESKEAAGEFQAELTCPVIPSLSSTTKWTTANLIKQEFQLKDKIMPGLTVGVAGDFNMENSSLVGKVLGTYRHSRFTLETGVLGGDGESTALIGSIVGGCKDVAGGYQFELDVNEKTLKKNNVALAYARGPLTFLASLDNAELLFAGLLYKHNPTLEFGITGNYKAEGAEAEGGGTVVGAVMKYVIDSCTAFKFKLDSNSQIGLGFETKLKPCAAITMSANFDGNNLGGGGHQVGLSFDLES